MTSWPVPDGFKCHILKKKRSKQKFKEKLNYNDTLLYSTQVLCSVGCYHYHILLLYILVMSTHHTHGSSFWKCPIFIIFTELVGFILYLIVYILNTMVFVLGWCSSWKSSFEYTASIYFLGDRENFAWRLYKTKVLARKYLFLPFYL